MEHILSALTTALRRKRERRKETLVISNNNGIVSGQRYINSQSSGEHDFQWNSEAVNEESVYFEVIVSATHS